MTIDATNKAQKTNSEAAAEVAKPTTAPAGKPSKASLELGENTLHAIKLNLKRPKPRRTFGINRFYLLLAAGATVLTLLMGGLWYGLSSVASAIYNSDPLEHPEVVHWLGKVQEKPSQIAPKEKNDQTAKRQRQKPRKKPRP